MFLLFSYDGSILISEQDFKSMVTSWAVFCATDVNIENELELSELKTMLWLIEGKEPDRTKVVYVMN